VRDFRHRAQQQPELILPRCTESLASPQPNPFEEKSRGFQRVRIAFLIQLRLQVAFAKHLFMCETGPALSEPRNKAKQRRKQVKGGCCHEQQLNIQLRFGGLFLSAAGSPHLAVAAPLRL
jgi:hypothetical protein